MKRRQLERYLRKQGCILLREGGNHSVWHNPATKRRAMIPRHIEIDDHLAKKICKQLGVKPIK